MAEQAQIDQFLEGQPYAVVGASTDREKYGNKVLRVYQQHGRRVFPVNPNADIVEGLQAYPKLSDLPSVPHGLSIVTPPDVTTQVVAEALELGVRNIWMQPGAESNAAVRDAEQAGANVIADGTCILVVLGFKNED
jgi:predicted CoA-binding protein